MSRVLNLTMPGHPRYQPKDLRPIFGYDMLYEELARVEIAVMETLAEAGIIPAEEFAAFTEDHRQRLFEITTTEVDEVERTVTKHDIRAWVRIAQDILGSLSVRRWLHVPLTSYDALDTARALQYRKAFFGVVKPKLKDTVRSLRHHAYTLAHQVQVGRTHGQHALPITVGFWLATILDRVVRNAEALEASANALVGKISGAVGAHNAQYGLGISACFENGTFESRVLEKLGLQKAKISTQILPPEPLAQYLFSAALLSAAFGQFGRDGRNLMRSEIGEVAEAYETGQVGSSTMAHKRNPINFEKLEGMWLRTKNEFGKVLDTLLSDHQRDLVGSSVMRDLPIIVINLTEQLDTLLKKDKRGVPFLLRVSVDSEACKENFGRSAHLLLAEPLYIALQMAGFMGDAHALINDQAMPMAKQYGFGLDDAIERIGREDSDLRTAWNRIPEDVRVLLHFPDRYIGDAVERTMEIVDAADAYTAK